MAFVAPTARAWPLACLLVVAGGLSGCGGDEPSEGPDDGRRLTEHDGCLLIGDAVAVFPVGTGWSPPWVTFRDGERVEVGDRVRMGGGTMEIGELTADGSPLVPVAAVRDCGSRTGAEEYVWAAPRG